jgi:hypothetical protein
VLDAVTVMKDPVPEAGPLLLLVNEPGPTDKVLPMDISLPIHPDATGPEFDCVAVPPVMPKLPVISVKAPKLVVLEMSPEFVPV